MKSLIVTDKQLEVIKNSCDLYGRIQIGQFDGFAEIVTQTGFNGWQLRIAPDRKEGETDERYKARCYAEEVEDRLVCRMLVGAINGIYREAYNWDNKPRTNESSIALDIWGFVDGRREGGFHMGSEPLPKLLELDGDTWKEMKK